MILGVVQETVIKSETDADVAFVAQQHGILCDVMVNGMCRFKTWLSGGDYGNLGR